MKKFLMPLVLLSACTCVSRPKFEEYKPTPSSIAAPTAKVEKALPKPTPRFYAIANLGIAKYQSVAKQSHPAGFANVSFTNAFTSAYNAIDDLLSTGKVPTQEYNLLWKDDHKFSRSDFNFIVNEAKRYVPLVNKYLSVGCLFSGATEHNYNKKDAQDLADLVLAVIPKRCIYINNPQEGHGAFINTTERIWNEVHGVTANKPSIGGKYIWSADGSDVFDIDITKMKHKFYDAQLFALWTSQNNGRKNRNDTTPRPQRKFWPTTNLMKMLAFLSTDQGAVNLPPNHLIKPKSDQHFVPPEDRALKPVFIFPGSGNTIELWAGGKKIITSQPGQPFADGRTRYYFSLFGYQIAALANTNVFGVYVRGKRIGKTNPGFRQGK